jgi:hypothetical protein
MTARKTTRCPPARVGCPLAVGEGQASGFGPRQEGPHLHTRARLHDLTVREEARRLDDGKVSILYAQDA